MDTMVRNDLKSASMDAIDKIVVHPADLASSDGENDEGVNQALLNIKKRKNDEVNILFDPELENPNERAALQSDDVFFDMKPRWRRAFMQELHRAQSAKNMKNDVILLCPDEDCKPLEALINDCDYTQDTASTCQTIPKSPAFRLRVAMSHGDGQGESPCGVDAFESGRVYFWQRSLAWSEDGDESPQIGHDQDDIRQHLSVPEKLGREYADNKRETQKSLRQLALEKDFRCRVSTTESFRQTDVDKITQIRWEEKVLDATNLEMANLSI
jgi:hypothetical protein